MRVVISALIAASETSPMRARKRRRLKNNDFCAEVVPVRTIDQLRRMKSCIDERIHHDA